MQAYQRPIPSEDAEQAALFEWAERASGRYPGLNLLYAIPNGGKRHIATAVRLKKTGVKAGVPDICLPVACGPYHGLYIEMKKQKGGRVSEKQKAWIKELQKQSYAAVVCEGWVQAQEVILRYLSDDEAPLPLL